MCPILYDEESLPSLANFSRFFSLMLLNVYKTSVLAEMCTFRQLKINFTVKCVEWAAASVARLDSSRSIVRFLVALKSPLLLVDVYAIQDLFRINVLLYSDYETHFLPHDTSDSNFDPLVVFRYNSMFDIEFIGVFQAPVDYSQYFAEELRCSS
ncbi:MAG: hypothetical protein MUO31_07745 [Thermodesulfovibrionales bacterium]|nr:hypothetical protein [Thermodesulfovibrionales bacterium]